MVLSVGGGDPMFLEHVVVMKRGKLLLLEGERTPSNEALERIQRVFSDFDFDLEWDHSGFRLGPTRPGTTG